MGDYMNEVFDKPVTLQKQLTETGTWETVRVLHADINKSVTAQHFEADNDCLIDRMAFKLRYGSWMEDIRNNLPDYRFIYFGKHYELVDYDDYRESRSVIKITGERYELPVTVELLMPTSTTVLGVMKQVYPASGTEISCRWEPAGSEERKVNGIVSVLDRAKLTARCRPAITSDCRIRRSDGTVWEIIGTPGNAGLSNRWQVFDVRRITGGA